MVEEREMQRIHVSSGLFSRVLKGHFLVWFFFLPSQSGPFAAGGAEETVDGCWRRGERMLGVSAAGGSSSRSIKTQALTHCTSDRHSPK